MNQHIGTLAYILVSVQPIKNPENDRFQHKAISIRQLCSQPYILWYRRGVGFSHSLLAHLCHLCFLSCWTPLLSSMGRTRHLDVHPRPDHSHQPACAIQLSMLLPFYIRGLKSSCWSCVDMSWKPMQRRMATNISGKGANFKKQVDTTKSRAIWHKSCSVHDWLINHSYTSKTYCWVAAQNLIKAFKPPVMAWQDV